VQICVSPDYVLVQREKQDELVKAFQKHYKAFFPEVRWTRRCLEVLCPICIITSHFTPCPDEGEVALRGRVDPARRRMEPTIVRDVADGDSLLEESVFPYIDRSDADVVLFIENSLVRYYLLCP